MDNFKPQIKGMKIASHDIDAKQFPTHCTVKNRIVFRPIHTGDEKTEPIKEISKFYATIPEGAVITELAATIGSKRLSSNNSNNWKDTVKCHAKKLFPHCKVYHSGDEIVCDTKPRHDLCTRCNRSEYVDDGYRPGDCNLSWCNNSNSNYYNSNSNFMYHYNYHFDRKLSHKSYRKLNDKNVHGTDCWTNAEYIYHSWYGRRYYLYGKSYLKYWQIGDHCENFLRDLGEIRKYDNKSDVICAITYQVPDMSIISKRDNFVKSVRIRVPTEIDPQEGPVISAKLENMKKSRKNRSVANVNGITIDAKIVKNKVGKKSKQSKQSKQRRINNDLEYDISDYYCNY